MVGVREPVGLGPHLRDRRSAPRARARRRRLPQRAGTPRSPPSPSRTPARGSRARSTRSRTSSAEPTLRRNDAPAGVGVRTSRCGDRGPVREPPPRNAPRRYAPRQHGRATTRPGGRSSGRWSSSSTPASRERGEGVLGALDVKLVPGRTVERPRRVGADLGRHAQLGEKREGTAHGRGGGEVEVERDRAPAAEVHGARRCGTAPRSPPAGRSARRGAIAASSARTSSASEPALTGARLRARAGVASAPGRRRRSRRSRSPRRHGGTG